MPVLLALLMKAETPQQKRDRLGQHICLKCGYPGSRILWVRQGTSGHKYRCMKCDNEWPRIPPKRKKEKKELTILMDAIANRIEDNQSRHICICKWVLAAIREVVPKNE